MNDTYDLFNLVPVVEFEAPFFFWAVSSSSLEIKILTDTTNDANYAQLYKMTTYQYYATLPSDVTRYPILHITTNTTTNMHNADGSKMNVIQVAFMPNS